MPSHRKHQFSIIISFITTLSSELQTAWAVNAISNQIATQVITL